MAHIDDACPVLTLGITVEKGIEDPAHVSDPSELMVRGDWDWSNLMETAPEIIETTLPACAKILKRPVFLRCYGSVPGTKEQRRKHYGFVDKRWFRRHEGGVETGSIMEALRTFDSHKNWWVDVFIGCDFSPSEVAEMDTEEAANTLLAFAPLRRMLRG